jgi:EAL domain-containing protein (putative c-di-GMP-specific phosphodiesterase class I)
MERNLGAAAIQSAQHLKSHAMHGTGVHFQTQYDAHTGRGCGVEAMPRGTRPQDVETSDACFVPIDKQLQLISKLRTSFLQQCCEVVASWNLAAGAMRTSLSVKVASRQINEDFCNTLRRVLQAAGLPGEHLELGIIGSTQISDFDFVVECLLRCKAFGVRVAIDDFGSGSNLEQIARLPIDALKLDKALLYRMQDSRKSAAIVRCVFALGKEAGITIMAHGVRSEDQLTTLQRLGCHQVQGTLFCRPAPAAQAKKMLHSIWGNRNTTRHCYAS